MILLSQKHEVKRDNIKHGLHDNIREKRVEVDHHCPTHNCNHVSIQTHQEVVVISICYDYFPLPQNKDRRYRYLQKVNTKRGEFWNLFICNQLYNGPECNWIEYRRLATEEVNKAVLHKNPYAGLDRKQCQNHRSKNDAEVFKPSRFVLLADVFVLDAQCKVV